jgi:type VI secretion system protein ImpL
MRSLRNQEVPGFGPVTSPGDDPAHPVLNPGLAREPAGLAALAKLEFMQAAPAPRSYCVIDAGWDGALLGRASAYAREYQAFADKLHLDGSAADPLFGRAARRQLQLAMDAAVAAAQQPEDAAPSTLDGPDGRMSARSARFAAATAPLATVTALYRQLGFAASATSLDSCVRDQASAALLQVGDLAQQSQVYAPPRAGDGALLFAMGDAAATDQFLANQLGRVKVLASYAEPYARYLQDSRPLADQQKSPSQLDPYWSNTIGELYRYQAATDSNGQAGKLHALFSRVLPTLDTGNCRKAAIGVVTDGGNDLFSDHRRTVSELAASRCGSLGDAQLLADYLAFADLYDSALAGRFPFGPVTAPDLPLDQARRFFAANGAQLASLRSRADQRKEPRWHARRAFLDQLDDARSLLIDQLAGPVPLKLALAFNARPGSSAGADQIANWTFTSADRSTGWPNRSPTTVAWRAGQAIALDLQWADRSAWHPLADPGQYDLTIEGATAGFAWGGDWALLRMLAQHRPREDGADGAIELRVPVGAAPDGRQSAFAYLYLGVALSSADPKTKADAPLTVPARFPHFAPR